MTWLAAGCGDDPVCGPDPLLPADGIVASIGGETITYGSFISSPNNDCTPPDREPTSITLDGRQLDPTPAMTLFMTFCLPRPDVIDAAPVTVGDEDTLQVIDVFAELSDGCLVLLDRTQPVSGEANFEGYCEAGLEPGGYALSLTASIPVTRMCDGGSDTIELSGRALVEALNF